MVMYAIHTKQFRLYTIMKLLCLRARDVTLPLPLGPMIQYTCPALISTEIPLRSWFFGSTRLRMLTWDESLRL